MVASLHETRPAPHDARAEEGTIAALLRHTFKEPRGAAQKRRRRSELTFRKSNQASRQASSCALNLPVRRRSVLHAASSRRGAT